MAKNSGGHLNTFDVLSHEEVQQIQQAINYQFKNVDLLCQAFCHSSFAKQHGLPDNERMEFFGDAVLEYVSSEYLFGKYADFDQGKLSKVRAALVSADGLRPAVERLDILQYLKVASNAQSIKSTSKKIEANLYEAVLCAIYLDGGIRAARKFILTTLNKELSAVNCSQKDVKSLVLEYCQAKKWTAAFETVERTGPDNQPTFVRRFVVNGKTVAQGTGQNKTAADRDAAKKIAKQWRID